VEREEIERRDFPVGRRGYEQDAVDAHLRAVADEIDQLKQSRPPAAAAPRPAASVAAGTSEQIRLILEAAERGATEMREDAGRQAKAHVARVEESAQGMLAKLEELQGELGALLDGLRAGGERLTQHLAELQAKVGDVDPMPEPAPAPEAEDFAAAAPEPEPAEPEPEPAPVPATAAAPADEAGARIIALNMALGGSSREETAAYLEENFSLADPGALLDDVYAKVGR
jgi:DivIVA domain-containing protein